jgi:uncharacterized caspase-like protein
MGRNKEELIAERVTPEDLDHLESYRKSNEELVAERAAGSVRIQEDLIEAQELGRVIGDALAHDEEPTTVHLPEQQHRILTISRQLGGVAAQL